MTSRKKPEKLKNVLDKIKKCIEFGKYILTFHAFDRQNERAISLPMTLQVLKTGYEEKRKTCFDNERNTWKYAIRGKTLDKLDVRVIVAFDEDDMLIITVISCRWLIMKETKRDTFIYEGLGFPIRLINVPMKKVFGEWAININFNTLQIAALNMLARKPTALTGGELRFIIDYLEMSTRDFAKLFGVTHAAVVKWEKEETKMNPSTEVYLRLYILNYLKVTDKEFRKLYLKINPANLANSEGEITPLEIDVDKIAC